MKKTKKFPLLDMSTDDFFGSRALKKEYNGKKPVRVYVVDEWFEASSWSKVKMVTYNKLIGLSAVNNLNGDDGIKISRSSCRRGIKLVNGMYTEVKLTSDQIVSHCIRFLELSGYNKDDHWKIDTI